MSARVRLRLHEGERGPGGDNALPDDERSAADAAGRPARSAHARSLARLALSDLATHVPPMAWTFEAEATGRPVVRAGDDRNARPELDVSLSHTGKAVAAVAAEGARVGVDIEDVKREVRHDALIERFFAPSERAWLARLSPDARRDAFFWLWVSKEAVIKAIGGALGRDIGRVELRPAPASWEPRPGESGADVAATPRLAIEVLATADAVRSHAVHRFAGPRLIAPGACVLEHFTWGHYRVAVAVLARAGVAAREVDNA